MNDVLLRIADQDRTVADGDSADNLDQEITVNRVAADAVEETVVVDTITAVITIAVTIIAAPVQLIGGQIRSCTHLAHAKNLN